MSQTRQSAGGAYAMILLALLPSATLESQTAPPPPALAIGERVLLHSRMLQKDRSLLVYLPERYSASTVRYPLLFFLGSDSDFLHTVGIVEFLSGTDQIPELILVGIPNTHRSRDLTPESPNDTESPKFWGEWGGADQFRRFFSEELIPFIDQQYRTAPYRIIRGQSFGGLFALYDYMSDLPMFDAYLTSSPAVTWNADELLERAPAFFSKDLPAPLYISYAGRENTDLFSGIQRFVRLVEQKQPGSPSWKAQLFDHETHYSLVHRSTYQALTFLYALWQVPDSVASQTDFARFEEHYARLSNQFGYSIPIPMHSVIRLGNNLLRAQRFDDGIAVFERSIELYPEQPEVYWHLADAYVLSGQPAKARPFFAEAYRRAIERSAPDLDDYRDSLEQVDLELGGQRLEE